MKHPVLRLLILLVALSIPFAAQATEGKGRTAEEMLKKGFKRYSIKSAIIEFVMRGSQEGSEWLYFDLYGLLEGKHTDAKLSMMGVKQDMSGSSFRNGDCLTQVDRAMGTATQILDPITSQMPDDAPNRDMPKANDNIMKMMNAELIGEGEIAGLPVLIYEMKAMGTKVWVWKDVGIALKTETSMMGIDTVVEAKNVQRDVDIPSDKLFPPENLEPQAVPDLNKLQDMMKNLDADGLKKLGEKMKDKGSDGGK